MEIKDTVVNVNAQDEPAGNEACLHSHDRSLAPLEIADTLTVRRDGRIVREVVWKKRGTLERARWHAGPFELSIRVIEVVDGDLLRRE